MCVETERGERIGADRGEEDEEGDAGDRGGAQEAKAGSRILIGADTVLLTVGVADAAGADTDAAAGAATVGVETTSCLSWCLAISSLTNRSANCTFAAVAFACDRSLPPVSPTAVTDAFVAVTCCVPVLSVCACV